MAKILNPKEPVRFSPEDQLTRPEGERIVYLLKVPDRWDRINLRKALAARGARQAGWLDLALAMRAIVAQNDAESARPVLASLETFIERVRAYGAQDFGTTDEGIKARVREHLTLSAYWDELKPLADICASASASFASLRGDGEVYLELASIEAARIFLRGWEGAPADGKKMPAFDRGVNGVPVETLELLPPGHVFAIYERLEELLKPTETEAGNSVSPSPGAGTQPTSETAAPTATPPQAPPIPASPETAGT